MTSGKKRARRRRFEDLSKTVGTGTGKGHGGNTPNLPVIRHDLERQQGIDRVDIPTGRRPAGTKIYKMGKCQIIVTPPWPEKEVPWRLSIWRPDRYPSWDEIAKARYELLPEDLTFAMLLPPPEEYVNIHNHTFQLIAYLQPGPLMRLVDRLQGALRKLWDIWYEFDDDDPGISAGQSAIGEYLDAYDKEFGFSVARMAADLIKEEHDA